MLFGTLEDIKSHQKKVNKAVRKSKAAKKAVGKAHRKLKKALRAQNVSEIKILLGMAQVAINKAEFIAKTTL